MHSCEVHINIPCNDHMDHIAKISPFKFRMSEDVVKVYSGMPEVDCVAVGTEQLVTARKTVVYNVGDVKMLKRYPLPNGSFEWFMNMDVVTLKRANVQATHCVRVEIDAYLDSGSKTTIIWKLSKDDNHQEERVMSLVQKLAPEMTSAYSNSIDVLKRSHVWKERS